MSSPTTNATASTASVAESLRDQLWLDPHVAVLLLFFRSWYFYGTILMWFLLYRIQHIVHPATRILRPTHIDRPDSDAAHSTSWLRKQWTYALSHIIPIDFSKPRTRFILRLPALILLGRALLMGFVTIGEVLRSDKYQLDWMAGALAPRSDLLEGWLCGKGMREIAWGGFVAICTALGTCALNNGLDGGGFGNTALTFNLSEVAMLYHRLGFKKLHSVNPKDLPSRPDIYGLILMVAPLLDLGLYTTIGIKKEWSRYRFIPTSVPFFLILASHVHSTIVADSPYGRPDSAVVWVDALTLIALGLSWALKGVTAVLLAGSLGPTFWSLPANMTLQWEDDFRTVLLKLVIASATTSSVSGFGNEMPSINAVDRPDAVVQITPTGKVTVTADKGKSRSKGGFNVEVKNIKVSQPTTSDGVLGGLLELDRWKLISQVVVTFGKLLLHTLKALRDSVFPKPVDVKFWKAKNPGGVATVPLPASHVEEQTDASEEEEDLYDRFVRGASIATDDGDEEFVPPSPDEDQDDDDDATERTESDVEEVESSLVLYEPEATEDAPILLTHMLDNSSSPMTRHRYHRTTAGHQALSQQTAVERPSPRPSDSEDRGDRQTCIVCYTEPRVVVCWPCRCLSLCDDCRSSLATLPVSQHLCPTCRVPVEGYSRIFVP